MYATGTYPFAEARGGLARGSLRGKCHKIENAKGQKGNGGANILTNRFKLIRPNIKDNGKRKCNVQQRKLSSRSQSACNLTNMNFIEQAIREYTSGSTFGLTKFMKNNQPNEGAQREMTSTRQNQRRCTATVCRGSVQPEDVGKTGQDDAAERDTGSHQRQSKQVCQKRPPMRPDAEPEALPNEQPPLPIKPVANQRQGNDNSRVCESSQKTDVKKQSLRPKVFVHRGAPTIIEVRPPPNLSKLSQSVGYPGRYSQDLWDSNHDGDIGLKPQGDVKAESPKPCKNSGDGLVVSGESAEDKNLRKSTDLKVEQIKRCSKHVCKKSYDLSQNNEHSEKTPYRRSKGEQRYENERRSSNRTSMQQSSNQSCCGRLNKSNGLRGLSRKQSSSDFKAQMAKQSEQRPGSNKPNHSYNKRTIPENKRQSSSRRRTLGDSCSDNSESRTDTSATKCEETKQSIKKTFQVTNNDTIVITPGLPTLIEVRPSKMGKGKCITQTTMLPSCDNSEYSSTDDNSGCNSCKVDPSEESDALSDSYQPEEMASQPSDNCNCSRTASPLQKQKRHSSNRNVQRNVPASNEVSFKQQLCSKCNRNKDKIAQGGAGRRLRSSGNKDKPFKGMNKGNALDAAQSKPPYMYQAQDYRNEYVAPPPPPAAPYPMQQYQPQPPPQQYSASMYPPHTYSPQYQPWNQYQQHTPPQPYPPLNYDLPQYMDPSGDQYFDSMQPKFDCDTCETDPDLNNDGYSPYMTQNYYEQNYC